LISDRDLKNARAGAARSWRACRGYVELDDLIGEAYLWLASNQKKVDEWRDDGKKGENMIALSCYRKAQKFVARERARRTGGKESDQTYYTIAMLEDLLPFVWSYEDWTGSGVVNELAPSSVSRPSEGNNRLAMLSDVAHAMRRLSDDERDLLRERFAGAGTPLAVLADEHGVHHSTIIRRIDNILTKMSDWLGGEPPWYVSHTGKRVNRDV
jgi:hypothetical protein